MNELERLSEERPEPGEPDPAVLARHRQALLERAADPVRRRFDRRKVAVRGGVVAALAGAAAVVLVLGLVVPNGNPTGPAHADNAPTGPAHAEDTPTGRADPEGTPTGPAHAEGTPTETFRVRVSPVAARVLDRAAAAARSKPDDHAGPGQWIYTKTVTAGRGTSKVPTHYDQTWRSFDGGETLSRSRYVYPDGHVRRSTIDTRDGSAIDTPDEQRCTHPLCDSGQSRAPLLGGASYKYLQGLPTDPAKLREIVYNQAHRSVARIKKRGGPLPTVHQRAYQLIVNTVMHSAVPGQLEAALYQVLKTIPGITIRRDVVDAIGRHGIGITNEVYEISPPWTLIFDEETYEFLGALLPAYNSATARIDSGIVAKAGQLP